MPLGIVPKNIKETICKTCKADCSACGHVRWQPEFLNDNKTKGE